MPFVDKKNQNKKKSKLPNHPLNTHNNDSEYNFSDILKSNTFVSSNDKRNINTHTQHFYFYFFICRYIIMIFSLNCTIFCFHSHLFKS